MGNMSSVKKSEVVYKVERKPDETTYSWRGKKQYIPSQPQVNQTKNTKSEATEEIACPFCAGVLTANGYEGEAQGASDLHRTPSFSQTASAKIKVYHESTNKDPNCVNGNPPNYNVTSYEDKQTSSFQDKRSFFEQFHKDGSSQGIKSSAWSEEAIPDSEKKSSIPNGDHFDLFPNLRPSDRASFRTSNASCSYVGGSTPGGVSLNESSGDNSSSFHDNDSDMNFGSEPSNWKEENLCEKHKHLRDWFRSGMYKESIAGFRKEIESLITKKDSGVYSPNDSFESDPKSAGTSQPQNTAFNYNNLNSRDSGVSTSVLASPSSDNQNNSGWLGTDNTTTKSSSGRTVSHEDLFDEIMKELEHENLEQTFGRFDRTYDAMCAESKTKRLQKQNEFEEDIVPSIYSKDYAVPSTSGSYESDSNMSLVKSKPKDNWNPESLMEQILESAGNESDDFQDLLLYHTNSVGRPVNRAEVSCKMTSEVGMGNKAFVKSKTRKMDIETNGSMPSTSDNVNNNSNDNAAIFGSNVSKDKDDITVFSTKEEADNYRKECDLLDFYRKVMNEENENLQKMLDNQNVEDTSPKSDTIDSVFTEEPNNNTVDNEADLQNYINIALASIHNAKEKIQGEIETATKEREEMSSRKREAKAKQFNSLKHPPAKRVDPFETPLRKSVSAENTTAEYYELDPLHPDNVDLLIATLTEPVQSPPPEKSKPKIPPKPFKFSSTSDSPIVEESPPRAREIIKNLERNRPAPIVKPTKVVPLSPTEKPTVPPKPSSKPSVPPKPIKLATFKTPLKEKQNVSHERTEVIYEGEQARQFLRRSSSISTSSSSDISARQSRETTPVFSDNVSYHRSTSHPSPEELDSVSKLINEKLAPIAEKENIKIDADKTLKKRKLRKPKLASLKPSNKVIKDVALFKRVIKPHNPKDGELVSEEISTEEVVLVLRYPKSLFIPKDDNIFRDIIHHKVTKIKGPENEDDTLAIEGPATPSGTEMGKSLSESGDKKMETVLETDELEAGTQNKGVTRTFSC